MKIYCHGSYSILTSYLYFLIIVDLCNNNKFRVWGEKKFKGLSELDQIYFILCLHLSNSPNPPPNTSLKRGKKLLHITNK